MSDQNEDRPRSDGRADRGGSLMFDAILTRRTLEAFTNPISAIVDECQIKITQDGIEVDAVEPANVAMVDAELDASAFESYDADSAAIAVNIDRLEDVISFADAGDLIRIAADNETQRLNISFDRVSYDLGLIDPDSVRDVPKIPDIEFPANVRIEASAVQRAVELADMTANQLRLGVDADADVFWIQASGDTDDVYIEYARDDLGALTAADVRSIYSLDYLADMAGVIPKDDDIRLQLGDNVPVELNYQIADDNGRCRFVLSPRIEKGGSD